MLLFVVLLFVCIIRYVCWWYILSWLSKELCFAPYVKEARPYLLYIVVGKTCRNLHIQHFIKLPNYLFNLENEVSSVKSFCCCIMWSFMFIFIFMYQHKNLLNITMKYYLQTCYIFNGVCRLVRCSLSCHWFRGIIEFVCIVNDGTLIKIKHSGFIVRLLTSFVNKTLYNIIVWYS